MISNRPKGKGSIHITLQGGFEARITINGKRMSKRFKVRRDAEQWLFHVSSDRVVDAGSFAN